MGLGGFFMMVGRVQSVSMRDVGVMGCLLMMAGFMMLCCVLVMCGSVRVMFGGLGVMLVGFFRWHDGYPPLADIFRHGCGINPDCDHTVGGSA